MSESTPNYKMAIVGPRESTQGFEALGIEAIDALNPITAVEKLFELKRTTQKIGTEERPLYAVIFVLEDLMHTISREDYQKLTAHALPAIIALPGTSGSSGFGVKRLSMLVERAVGQDILGK